MVGTIATIQPPAAVAPDLSWAHEMVARGEAHWSGIVSASTPA